MLNTIGLYASQQLLLHIIRPIVDGEFDNVKGVRTYSGEEMASDEGVHNGPATTWPLGEILASRHNLNIRIYSQ